MKYARLLYRLLLIIFIGLLSALLIRPKEVKAAIDLPGEITWTGPGGSADTFTYTEDSWSFTGATRKPSGSSPFAGIVISHGKGGAGIGFCGIASEWFPNYVEICPNYTHAASSFGGNDDSSSWAGSAENVKRATKALDILESQELAAKIGVTVDTERLFMWGNSMGAMVTVATAAQVGNRIKAAAYTAGGLSSTYEPKDPAIAQGVGAPFLMLHALNDGTVDPQASRDWRDALITYDKTYQLVFFTSGGHNMMHDPAYKPVLGELMRAWFENPVSGLTSISPNFGQTGTAVTYTGTNFGANPGNLSSVTFISNKLGSVTSWAGTSVKADVPSGAVSGPTRVVVPQGPVTNSLISTSEPVTGGKRTNGIHFTVGNSPSNPPPSSSMFPSPSGSPAFAKGDVNHDTFINSLDATIILTNFSKQPSQVINYFDPVDDLLINTYDFAWVVRDW